MILLCWARVDLSSGCKADSPGVQGILPDLFQAAHASCLHRALNCHNFSFLVIHLQMVNCMKKYLTLLDRRALDFDEVVAIDASELPCQVFIGRAEVFGCVLQYKAQKLAHTKAQNLPNKCKCLQCAKKFVKETTIFSTNYCATLILPQKAVQIIANCKIKRKN